MMRAKYVRLLSDLHMEMGGYKFVELDTDPETILILAGDINVGVRAAGFIDQIHGRFLHVIYVLGNHEYYGNDINSVRSDIQKKLKDLNIICVSVIDKAEVLLINGQKFVCGTLWTDLNRNDADTHTTVGEGLNDFYLIKNHWRKFSTQDAYSIHVDTLSKFKAWIDRDTIVVTHHMPAEWCVDPIFRDCYKLNGGFRSCLEEFIQDTSPRYWFHGHGHNTVNFKLGDTRIISNPRGYPRNGFGEIDNPQFNDTLLIGI